MKKKKEKVAKGNSSFPDVVPLHAAQMGASLPPSKEVLSHVLQSALPLYSVVPQDQPCFLFLWNASGSCHLAWIWPTTHGDIFQGRQASSMAIWMSTLRFFFMVSPWKLTLLSFFFQLVPANLWSLTLPPFFLRFFPAKNPSKLLRPPLKFFLLFTSPSWSTSPRL